MEWVVTDADGNTYTHALYSFLHDRQFTDGQDHEIAVGERFCASRIAEGENNKALVWGELAKDENGVLEIKVI